MRGKAAAQSANRRAQEAQGKVAELEAVLAYLREKHRAETTTLRAERDQARNRLISEVDALAKASVREANAAATETVQRVRDELHGRIITGFRWMVRHAIGGSMPRDLVGCADAFGVAVGDLTSAVDQGEFNRRGRRISTKQARDVVIFEQETARSGRPVFQEGKGG